MYADQVADLAGVRGDIRDDAREGSPLQPRFSPRLLLRVPTPDPTRGNRKSQFTEFYGGSTQKVDSTYLKGGSLEPFLTIIATRKI